MNLIKKSYLIILTGYKYIFLLIFFLTISCSKNQVKVKLDDACKFQDEKKEILICDEEKIWKITRKKHPKFFKNCQEIQYHTIKNKKKFKNTVYKCEYLKDNYIFIKN